MENSANTKIQTALELHQKGNLDEAEKLYEEILSATPNDINALNLLGFLQIQTGKYKESVNYLKKAVELHPSFFDAWFNLGLACKNNNQLDDSIAAYKNAIAIQTNNPAAYYNLAGVYELKNDTQTAVEYYKKALEYKVDAPESEIRYLLGTSYLKIKNFEEGLSNYEFRISRDFAAFTQEQSYGEKFKSKPFWQGEDIKDKTIFLYYEAGLGDTILYYRYIPILKNMCKKILFRPQMCFVDLLKTNDFGAQIIDNKFRPEELEFDIHAPIMSLPFLLKQFTEKAPFPEGYIKADVEKSRLYKEKYFNNNKFKIGIKWMGNTAYDLNRVIGAEDFYGLFDLPNTQFYSVQKGDGIEELEKIPSKYNIVNLGETFNNFSDTAAAIDNLDLVICNDTSVAHLAGAMGKLCWILLPFVQNWRWFNDLTYSPWYNSVSLFKQAEPGNWEEVFDSVKQQLDYLINMQSP